VSSPELALLRPWTHQRSSEVRGWDLSRPESCNHTEKCFHKQSDAGSGARFRQVVFRPRLIIYLSAVLFTSTFLFRKHCGILHTLV